jgi:hypothetical protein
MERQTPLLARPAIAVPALLGLLVVVIELARASA